MSTKTILISIGLESERGLPSKLSIETKPTPSLAPSFTHGILPLNSFFPRVASTGKSVVRSESMRDSLPRRDWISTLLKEKTFS